MAIFCQMALFLRFSTVNHHDRLKMILRIAPEILRRFLWYNFCFEIFWNFSKFQGGFWPLPVRIFQFHNFSENLETLTYQTGKLNTRKIRRKNYKITKWQKIAIFGPRPEKMLAPWVLIKLGYSFCDSFCFVEAQSPVSSGRKA